MTYLVEGLTSANDVDEQVRRIGEFERLDDAIQAARRTIDQYLQREFSPGMSSGQLYARYQTHGEVPVIFRDDDARTLNVGNFNHFEYAMSRCTELAAGADSRP